MRSYQLISLLFFLSFSCAYGQFGIGTGLDYGTAVFVNGRLYAKRPSTGLFGEMSYRIRDRRFYPSFTYAIRSMAIQMHNNHFKGLEDDAADRNFVLRMNYRTLEENKYALFFLGVGIAHIVPDNNLVDNLGYTINMTDTGSNNIYPIIQAGVKQMWRILPNSGFYIGVEGSIAYIQMNSQTAYYLNQGSTTAKANIGGDIVAPAVGIKLEYFFGRSMEE